MIKNGGAICRFLIRRIKMEKLNIIPMPNKITYLGGETDIDGVTAEFVTDGTLGEEEYILTADASGVTIISSCPHGAFLAKQTLAQMKGKCPCVRIEDKPAFAYRGFHLDTVRHMTGIEDTKKLIDAAASVKMNVFHWHLTDDQGFRFYSEKRPDATAKGSVRPGSHFGKLKEEGEYGGFFTKEEMKEITEYCAERFITVIPEFEMPGHCSAIIHAYPELGCGSKPVDIKMKQGVFEDILCPGKDGTFDILFDILSEMLEIFPSEYIHIGGDEAPKKHWKECPDCQKRIADEKLADEEALQGWFTNKIVDFLASKGRKAIVWNESLKSGIVDDSVTVQMWMDKKGLSWKYADNGGKVINSEFFAYYCDYPYGMTPLNKTYNYDPIPKDIKTPENIIGVEAPIWTEFINDFDRLCYMCFPRFTAAAETGWTLKENKDAADFRRRFRIYSEQLKKLGITPAPPKAWNPGIGNKLGELVSFFSHFLVKNK